MAIPNLVNSELCNVIVTKFSNWIVPISKVRERGNRMLEIIKGHSLQDFMFDI